MRKVLKILLFLILLFTFFSNNNLSSANLDNNYSSIKQKMDFDDEKLFENGRISNLVEECIDFLSAKGTTIEKELQSMLEYYEKILYNCKNERVLDLNKISQIEGLIENISDMIYSYKDFQQKEKLKSIKTTMNNTYEDMELFETSEYLLAHTAIVSYFSSQNYVLAAELLTHMRKNNSYDSVYKPINSDVFRLSKKFNEIVNKNEFTGSDDFEIRENTTIENDMYYSVNKFNYSKSIHNDVIVLTDRYDFDYGIDYDNFITQEAVNVMYHAQQNGFLTPFYTVIEIENSVNTNMNSGIIPLIMSNWRYNEYQATLAKNETLVYSLKFDTTGYRNIQTFGYYETYLRLEFDDETLITQDYGSGYDKNALILCNFIAGVEYHLILSMNNSNDFGNVRIAITASEVSSYDSIEKIKNTKNIEVNNKKRNANLYTLVPKVMRKFVIQTSKKDSYTDTYLIFVDPRRADVNKDNTPNDYDEKDEKFYSCIRDDDSGGNWQAKLTLVKQNYKIPFLVIACHFTETMITPFYLNILGLDE